MLRGFAATRGESSGVRLAMEFLNDSAVCESQSESRREPASHPHDYVPGATRAGANQPPRHQSARREMLDLHGQATSYLDAGAGSDDRVLVLLHGLGSHANTWTPLLGSLSRQARVLAPDLLGHGQSAAPRGADYTVGGHACRVRDLLRLLGTSRVHVVGHSFGAGVAMSFAYQFPERVQSLTLIASGGFGPELSVLLRAASLPGVVAALWACTGAAPRPIARLARRAALSAGVAGSAELDAMGRLVGMLATPERRRAVVTTLREAVGWSGQRIDATDRLYLLADLPILLIAGSADTCIPYQHTLRAHQLLPHARLRVLDAGHFPHAEYPDEVAGLITEHVAAGAGQATPATRWARDTDPAGRPGCTSWRATPAPPATPSTFPAALPVPLARSPGPLATEVNRPSSVPERPQPDLGDRLPRREGGWAWLAHVRPSGPRFRTAVQHGGQTAIARARRVISQTRSSAVISRGDCARQPLPR